MAKQIDHSNDYWKGLVNKSITKYIVMTIIGCALFTIGFIFVIVGAITSATGGLAIFLVIFGTILMVGPGLALMGVGVPCWVSLGIQIKIARKRLGIDK